MAKQGGTVKESLDSAPKKRGRPKKSETKAKTSEAAKKTETKGRQAAQEARFESLAMIDHVLGDGKKHRPKKTRNWFKLKRLEDALDADWSLWHLSWSITWRVVFIVVLLRLLATFSALYVQSILTR